jgi:hypothetical protein
MVAGPRQALSPPRSWARWTPTGGPPTTIRRPDIPLRHPYALSHAYGAAFDNPDLIVACVVGDGEAETGPLATSTEGDNV